MLVGIVGERHVETFRELARVDSVQAHRLVEDNDWADVILFVDSPAPADPFARQIRKHPVARRFPGKIAVYDQRDQPLPVLPGIYVSGAAKWNYSGIVGGPYASALTEVSAASIEPDLLFSFVGSRTHPVRDAVVSLRHERAIVTDSTHRANFFSQANDRARDEAADEYATATTRAKFVLCPRGFGVSSYRLFETLRAGRVPVVISDNWLPPPRIDWDSCIIRIAQRDVAQTPTILETLEPRWPELVAAGTKVVENEFRADRLWNHFCTSLASLSTPLLQRVVWRARRPVIGAAVRRQPRL